MKSKEEISDNQRKSFLSFGPGIYVGVLPGGEEKEVLVQRVGTA